MFLFISTNFYCLSEFYLYIDFIDFALKMATGNR